jgi:hypothetical protein
MKTAPGQWLEAALAALPAAERAWRTALVRRAMLDIGIEEGPSANRSPYIDGCLLRSGTRVGQPWCAAILHTWCVDAGCWAPARHAASCDAWRDGARTSGRWIEAPGGIVASDAVVQPGDIAVYGTRKSGVVDANHIGVVARVTHRGPRAVEGNTSFAGFEREGIAVDYKPVALARLLGYIVPRPV